MSDENEETKKQAELKKLEDELRSGGLSRRIFLNRLSALGIGFGAAATLGLKGADAAVNPETGVSVSSDSPAVDEILAESEGLGDGVDPNDPMQHMAQYRRYYRRGYRRYRRGYRRSYRRYRRGYRRFYRRYARGYRRFYRRW